MRTLLAVALAATLAGCSTHSLPQSVASTRTEANGFASFNKGATRSAERRLASLRSPTGNRVGTKMLKSSVVAANAELPLGQPAGQAVAGPSTSMGTNLASSSPKSAAATDPNTRLVHDQVTAATAMAERMTAATAVALVMARPEIKSVSDLANQNVAIDARVAASNSNVRTAIVSAGAAEVRLSEAQSGALDRVISGESPAAVLTLVSPDAADQFPDVTGYRIFRIQLSPHSAIK
jgi:hypothetical protein